MTIGSKPPAEVAIEPSLIRALLREQHPDLAHLAVVDVGEGWDNRLFRLGDGLAVRVPRRAAAAALVEHEHRWLPLLASRLPLPIPVPLRVGRPGCGFPWPWSVVPWLPGQNALLAPPRDPAATATDLGRFLHALHQPAPADAPRNPWRGVPLATRTKALRDHLQQVGRLVDHRAVLKVWERAVASPVWSGPPLWIHGDLHPGNLLVTNGRLSAVIDFGDLAAGDPATDLSVLWMLPSPVRATGLDAARNQFNPLDTDTRMRARGWALALGLVDLTASRDDETMAAVAMAAIAAALNDEA